MLIGAENEGFKLLKSGLLRDRRIIDELKKQGIQFPARFEIISHGGNWLGKLVSNSKQTKAKTKQYKPSRADMHSLKEKEQAQCRTSATKKKS